MTLHLRVGTNLSAARKSKSVSANSKMVRGISQEDLW
jgi:hypothetical protein